MFSFDTKREPEKCQRFRRAGATKKGLLAPFNPKEVSYTGKDCRFTPVRRESSVFSGSADLKPLSLATLDSSPRGAFGMATKFPAQPQSVRACPLPLGGAVA